MLAQSGPCRSAQAFQPTPSAAHGLDLPVRPRNDRILARRIAHARGEALEGSGHAFPFQDATQVGGAIDGFSG
jgi:hypothetical protein